MGKYKELRAKRKADGSWHGGSVYRKTVEAFDHRGRKIIVGLEPGDVISFREERTRRTYKLDISWAFHQAILKEVEQQRREKNGDKPRRRRSVKRGLLR